MRKQERDCCKDARNSNCKDQDLNKGRLRREGHTKGRSDGSTQNKETYALLAIKKIADCQVHRDSADLGAPREARSFSGNPSHFIEIG